MYQSRLHSHVIVAPDLARNRARLEADHVRCWTIRAVQVLHANRDVVLPGVEHALEEAGRGPGGRDDRERRMAEWALQPA